MPFFALRLWIFLERKPFRCLSGRRKSVNGATGVLAKFLYSSVWASDLPKEDTRTVADDFDFVQDNRAKKLEVSNPEMYKVDEVNILTSDGIDNIAGVM